jgi:general secretion pathway protein K
MRRAQDGFALLVVLFTVGFLALLGTQIGATSRSDTQEADNLRQQAVLEAAAEGAVVHVAFSLLAVRDPRFQADDVVREIVVGQTPVLVRVAYESDRVNLNTASGALLRALVINVGGAPDVASRTAAAILDWRTSGAFPRPGGAKTSDYREAGRAYGPPGAPFQSIDELAEVLGMTPDLLAALAPHLTVLTDSDPDLSTRDRVVASALSDAAGVADDSANQQQATDAVLRISATAVGPGRRIYPLVVVVSADFQNRAPRLKILSHERGAPVTTLRQVALAAPPGFSEWRWFPP